jgi:MtN3 and saliva related transmembrane protein
MRGLTSPRGYATIDLSNEKVVYNMGIYEILQLVGGIILSVGSIPQLEQIVRTKSVEDINLTSIITLILGMLFMEMYAIHSELAMFVITNTLSLVLAITKLSLKIYYTKRA